MGPECRPLDEDELIYRAQRDDVDAYEELVRRYQELAVRTAYVLTHDSDMAKDAAQTGFIKAYYALNRFRPGVSFRPWLLKIVVNEARNHARSAHRRTRYELQLAQDVSGQSGESSPESAALAAIDRAILLTAVNQLSIRDQQVIAYRYFLDLSEAEMADALGCARGTVKSRLARALERLRERLGDDRVKAVDTGVRHE